MRTKARRIRGDVATFLLFGLLFTAPAWAQDVKDQSAERRAIEAAVWGMPIVNFHAIAMD